MCEFHDDEPQSVPDSKGHKRNLSSGTADASPVRRSKRQRSTINLKEQSSSDESEGEDDKKVTPAKTKQTKKTGTPSSTKKIESPEAKAVSDVKSVYKEPTEVKAEDETVASTQKAKSTPAKRGKKTKEQKESEAMPLAPRTQGLKMFVGAHVSAAKGVFNSIHNSEHIG
jgi:AP endonuclease-1